VVVDAAVRDRNLTHVHRLFPAVERLERAIFIVAKHLLPDALRISNEHHVRVLFRLFRPIGNVQATENY